MAGMFEPYMPGFSAQIYFFLGMTERTLDDEKVFERILNMKGCEEICGLIPKGLKMNEPISVFERIDKVDHWREQFSKGQQN